MAIIKLIQNRKWVTVGMKILAGVAIASNIFIGALLYFNLHSSKSVEATVNEVLTIREQLSTNLRAALFAMQNKFISLPQFFHIDPHVKIVDTVKSKFKIIKNGVIDNRDIYTKMFSRNERRDISKGEFVVKQDGKLLLAFGIFDDAGNFKESVEYFHIESENIEADAQNITELIAAIKGEMGSVNALNQKVAELGSIVADAAMAAEKTRNEILDHVESINSMEHKLFEIRTYQRRFTIIMGVAAILANMVVLFILVRIIVERPLHNLTHTIDQIRAGKNPDIPCSNRRDQIGVLSGAIINFREALLQIREDNERKAKESIIIDEVFSMINSVVQTLEERAKKMVNCADTLHELATTTGNKSESVYLRANDTAAHTDSVSRSTSHLQAVVESINSQMLNQKRLVGSIIEKNNQSHSNIEQLNQSIADINGIISIIREITDQTKLLALNATIEANRAGSSGQGFSVVASEVKLLSMKTQQATKDVMEKVAAIEAASSVFFENLNDIDRRIVDLNDVTTNILKAVDEQKEVADNIASLAGQTSDNTKDVSLSIEAVSNAAGQTRSLSKQVHTYSDEIANQLTKLLVDTSEKLNQISRLSPDSHNIIHLNADQTCQSFAIAAAA
ncbi:MAG: hypothetical protein HQK68_12140 [Desulfamplus sp.]|nr:hypothetical protein [Desulfamplus sp.]